MPDFPIIDSHVHLYDPAVLPYGWMKGVPKLNRPHLLPEFDAARGSVAVEGIIFAEVDVDPGYHLAEATFVEKLGQTDQRLIGIVAHAPLHKGAAVEEDLIALKRHPQVCGIRRLIQGEVNPAICLEPDFIAGVKLLAKYDLVFDICVKSWALPYGLELAKRCPQVRFVLDHIGKPDIRNGLREPWWGVIRELARHDNVVVKLSGVISEAHPEHWRAIDVIPYMVHVIDCFGFERVMYGSDWSVSSLTHEYPAWVALIDEVVHGASESEKRALYRETALRSYRLPA